MSALHVAARRVEFDWLFSRRADLAMTLVPALMTAVAFAVALALGQDIRGSARALHWVATAYLFGNTSHVLLTFLLLGARRDMLHATDRQAAT